MRVGAFRVRWARRSAVVVLAVTAATLAGQSAQAAAGAAGGHGSLGAGAARPGTGSVADPYSPAYRHPYRHGAVPTTGRLAKMRAWARSHPALANPAPAHPAGKVRRAGPSSSPDDLNYGGGIDGIGVTTGHEKVYLVLYGSQWGTQGTDGSGNLTFSGDTSGEAPYLQTLMKGLGTGGEMWSGVMTQYCDGVAVGAQSCPAGSNLHVAYPAGGALAGVWLDGSAASPASSTGNQLGSEAVKAAAHFGNVTAAANRNAQYVIMSPTGTDPDGWLENGFCAWHDYTGDTTLSGGAVASPYGDIAFTNLPYILDAGFSCGQGFVGTDLDGVSIVEGHEYAETITDQNPAGGWTDSGGEETGDKCAWISPGTSGGAFDLTTTTGSFAMQTTWSNDGAGGAGDCEASHVVVTNAGESTVTVTNPGSQTSPIGTAVSLQLKATDSTAGQTLTYSATGLPPGLSMTAAGLVSGTPTAADTYSVTVGVFDSAGMPGSATFTWTIAVPGGGIVNGGFETGNFFGWIPSGDATSIVSTGQHSGSFAAQAGSPDNATSNASNLTQNFTVPSGDGKLSFWYDGICPSDLLFAWTTATLTDNTTGVTTTPVPPTCVSDSGWTLVAVPVAAGDSYTLTLTNQGDGLSNVYSLLDDVALAPVGPNRIVNGGFETGTFAGWTTSGSAVSSIVSSGQLSGNFAAQAGSSTDGNNGDSDIAQTFTAASGDSVLALWYDATCWSFNSGDGLTVILTDNTTGSASTLVGPGLCNFGDSGWTQVFSPVTAGHSYTLTLTSTDTVDSSIFDTFALFDDVSVY